VRLWVEDFKFHLARALRAVGVALGAVAWVSVLGYEAQQSTEVRTYAIVATAVLGVCITQWFAGLPPSARVVDVLRAFERDIIAVAREHAGGDARRLERLLPAMVALAAVRIERIGGVPRDRREWLRAVARMADSLPARH
jgi:hypothetical protein